MANKEIQKRTVTKSTRCKEYFESTDDNDKISETINIKKKAMFNFNFLISKFKQSAVVCIIMQNLIKVNKKMRHISLNRIRF